MNKGILCCVLCFGMFLFPGCSADDGLTAEPEHTIDQAIQLGAEWFLQNQDGQFLHYEYNLERGAYEDGHHSLREMGALWSITEAADYLDDPRLSAMAKSGFDYFAQSFETDPDAGFTYVNVTPEKIKLGYSAFAILTLLELDHPKKEALLTALADGILYQQGPDGRLRTFFYADRATGIDYYPGEALVALMALYEKTGDVRYLRSLENAFPYYNAYFEKHPNTAFVPWQSRAYRMYYDNVSDPEIAAYLFAMNDFMLEENRPQHGCSDFDFPRGITTAVFLEGVIQAYHVAELEGDEERKVCYGNFIQEAVPHILDLQVRESDHAEAMGGFTGSQTSSVLRVDQNQHAIMALMEAQELGILD